MGNEVFLCCAPEDRIYADAVCHHLESGNIKCWYAFRDMPLNAEPAELIPKVIAGSKILVYILSEHSCDSHDILSQINAAVGSRIDIITLRISDVGVSHKLRYYIAGSHWLDAFTLPMDDKLNQLQAWVEECIRHEKKSRRFHRFPRNVRKAMKILLAVAVISGLVLSSLALGRTLNKKTMFQNVFTENAYLENIFVSEDETLCAVPDEGGNIHITDIATGKETQVIETGLAGEKMNAIFCKDKKTLIALSPMGGAIYDLTTGRREPRPVFDSLELKDTLGVGNCDAYIDFFIGGKELLLTNRIVRYDYQKDKILMQRDLRGYIEGYSKDDQYIIMRDDTGEVFLINNLDFSKPVIRGPEAYRSCIGNSSPYLKSFSPDGGYFYKLRFQATMNLSIISCSDAQEVYTSNFDFIKRIFFYDENKVLVFSNSAVSVIDFLTREKTNVFNQTILDKYKELNDKLIIDLALHRESSCVFVLLQDKAAKRTKLYIIDIENNRLLQECEAPGEPDNLYLAPFEDKVLIIYSSEGRISMDYTVYSKTDNKKQFSYVKK